MTKAIIHIDGDAFFASCEQAVHPEYRGKPVITGAERGIVAAASYEAKRYGIQRGVPLWQVKQKCPQAIIVPSDYETYSIFSERMFSIMRRFTPDVEEYGIDEGFADLTGLRASYHCSYPQLAQRMKLSIQSDLGITVSVGLAHSKVLAKLGSKWKKPDGLTVIATNQEEQFLRATPTINVWGIGHNTTAYLAKYAIHSAWDFTQQPEAWVTQHLAKPLQEIWHELRGDSVLPLLTVAKVSYQSISKTKTFTPASTDPVYLFAQLSKNIENAFIKARRYQLATKKIAIFLKTQQFRYQVIECRLNRATAWPSEVLGSVKQQFQQLVQPGTAYRATGVVLFDLLPSNQLQLSLFETGARVEQWEKIYASVDQLSKRYGKHTVFQGSSLLIHNAPDQRQQQRKLGNSNTVGATPRSRQFLGLPLLSTVV